MTNADIFSVYNAARTNEDGGGYSNSYYQNLHQNSKKEKEKKDSRERNDTSTFGENLDENMSAPHIDRELEKRIMELGARHQAKIDRVYFEKFLSPDVLNDVQRDNATMTNPFIRKQIDEERAKLQDDNNELQQQNQQNFDVNEIYNMIYDKLLAEVYNKLYNELYSKLYTNISNETEDEIDKIELRVRGMKKYIEMLETRIEELEFEIKKLTKTEK